SHPGMYGLPLKSDLNAPLQLSIQDPKKYHPFQHSYSNSVLTTMYNSSESFYNISPLTLPAAPPYSLTMPVIFFLVSGIVAVLSLGPDLLQSTSRDAAATIASEIKINQERFSYLLGTHGSKFDSLLKEKLLAPLLYTPIKEKSFFMLRVLVDVPLFPIVHGILWIIGWVWSRVCLCECIDRLFITHGSKYRHPSSNMSKSRWKKERHSWWLARWKNSHEYHSNRDRKVDISVISNQKTQNQLKLVGDYNPSQSIENDIPEGLKPFFGPCTTLKMNSIESLFPVHPHIRSYRKPSGSTRADSTTSVTDSPLDALSRDTVTSMNDLDISSLLMLKKHNRLTSNHGSFSGSHNQVDIMSDLGAATLSTTTTTSTDSCEGSSLHSDLRAMRSQRGDKYIRRLMNKTRMSRGSRCCEDKRPPPLPPPFPSFSIPTLIFICTGFPLVVMTIVLIFTESRDSEVGGSMLYSCYSFVKTMVTQTLQARKNGEDTTYLVDNYYGSSLGLSWGDYIHYLASYSFFGIFVYNILALFSFLFVDMRSQKEIDAYRRKFGTDLYGKASNNSNLATSLHNQRLSSLQSSDQRLSSITQPSSETSKNSDVRNNRKKDDSKKKDEAMKEQIKDGGKHGLSDCQPSRVSLELSSPVVRDGQGNAMSQHPRTLALMTLTVFHLVKYTLSIILYNTMDNTIVLYDFAFFGVSFTMVIGVCIFTMRITAKNDIQMMFEKRQNVQLLPLPISSVGVNKRVWNFLNRDGL
ncbi:hypothetical protein ADUPG1_012485, partial [Aduncisulcus paluster]